MTSPPFYYDVIVPLFLRHYPYTVTSLPFTVTSLTPLVFFQMPCYYDPGTMTSLAIFIFHH